MALFRVLEELVKARGETVSRTILSIAALGRDWDPLHRSVDQLVFTLRLKLPLDAERQSLVGTTRNVGYFLRAEGVPWLPDSPGKDETGVPMCAPELEARIVQLASDSGLSAAECAKVLFSATGKFFCLASEEG